MEIGDTGTGSNFLLPPQADEDSDSIIGKKDKTRTCIRPADHIFTVCTYTVKNNWYTRCRSGGGGWLFHPRRPLRPPPCFDLVNGNVRRRRGFLERGSLDLDGLHWSANIDRHFLHQEKGHLQWGDVPLPVTGQPAFVLENQIVQIGAPGRGSGRQGQYSLVVIHGGSSPSQIVIYYRHTY